MVTKKEWLIGGVVGAVTFSVGIIIGVYGVDNSSTDLVVDTRTNVDDQLINAIDNMSIREWLRKLTVDPHVGGTPEEENTVAGMISSHMEEQGLKVKVSEYEVLLSYPQREENMRNYVAVTKDNVVVKDKNGNDLKSAEVEQILDESQNNTKVFNPFIAYATAGQIYGQPVYVNYGRQEDFEEAIKIHNLDLQDKICFVRYGKIFRGNKARYAENYGCAGMVLFSDKKDYAPDWSEPYPKDWFLPGTGAQRGTTYLDEGDPETPFYPSIDGAYRWTREKTKRFGDKHDLPGLPGIPIQPIGYDDAYKFLSRMTGKSAPADWQGGITHEDGSVIDYKLDGFGDNGEEVFMYIKNEEKIRKTKDIVGYIEGSEEPDKYVILGNHRDAWVFGAIDPTSGTCVMMEVISAFGELLESGWRPKRSLLFASWGSEEYGLIGSQEWVEEHFTNLQPNAVVYINTDIAVTGNYTFSPGGTPNTRDIVLDVTKLIENPRRTIDSQDFGGDVATLYDNMKLRNSRDDRVNFPPVGSGSDYAPFLQSVGVSVVDVNFASDGYYPVYHSVYETFELVDAHVDPGFYLHQSVARFLALLAERFSCQRIVPLSVNEYAAEIDRQVNMLKADSRMVEGRKLHAELEFTIVEKYTMQLLNNAATFTKAIMSEQDPGRLRVLNEKLFRFERAFIDENKLPNQLQFKHVVFAPSSSNTYASAAFPGVYDALFGIDWADEESAENVKEQFSTLMFFIYNAAHALSLDYIL